MFPVSTNKRPTISPQDTKGYWHQRADERFGDPRPKVDPGAFSSQREGWKTPKGTPGSALLLGV